MLSRPFALSSSSVLLLVSLTALLSISAALKCKFLTVDLAPVGSDVQPGQQSEEKEYECPGGDKYCVVVGGVLYTQPKNLTFALRSCESDVKRYMDPISEKIGQRLDYACSRADGKNHTVGPLTYWYNCCQTDDCNRGAGLYTGIALLLLGVCMALGSMMLVH